LIDESKRVWTTKRRKYADTTPWMLDELLRVSADLPPDWDESGLDANCVMIADFARELHAQGILPRILTPAELFPLQASSDRPKLAAAES
jgi:4,5-dihydroxyphthalate decarboxylase